jgi:hypothetical protein
MKNLTLTEAIQVTGHLLEHHATTGVMARNQSGKPIDVHDPKACCWCYIGAQFLVTEMFDNKFQVQSKYFQTCDSVSGIEEGEQWDKATPDERLRIARKLQAYNG